MCNHGALLTAVFALTRMFNNNNREEKGSLKMGLISASNGHREMRWFCM
jgi:hypothetical protein